ncbi:glycine betaine ABC transporter substrate-binding protein [Thermostichus vulcanus]|uniref:Quaternary ammonium transporter n=1 Tax=Thermostichus vulcanus str. 'Rupite' TaxID=2813851 RepID=A0ABT0C7E9_THEVL|nr:glycine betaine ABC transporter substrate-binding protein [Thermostichus vulcanus]MCJ2541713.1 quaternary ammonium transporter [Thermostichus vulcanus str. 'Rupite']
MLKTTRRLVLLALSGLAALTLAPQVSRADTITVGSKDFTEQFILGEMYALALEAAGFTVERKLNLGGTPVAHAGLLSGEIDLYPEYTGTGLLTVLKLPTSGDPAEVYETVAREYEAQFQLIWLDPAPMNNTQALAMTRARAAELGIATLSDMAAKASELVMIGPPEFQAREDGLPGIQATYGNFRLKEYKAVDPGLRYRGLVNGEADVAVAFGTDGEIAAFDLVLLEDDKQLFPPYQVAPVVRQDTLEANPGIAEALNALSPLLTDAVMQELNYEVSGNQKEPADVARAFLVKAGILTE